MAFFTIESEGMTFVKALDKCYNLDFKCALKPYVLKDWPLGMSVLGRV